VSVQAQTVLAALFVMASSQPAQALPRLFVVATSATGVEHDELAAVEGSWAYELGRTRRYDVITRAEVDALFAAEKRKDLAGCDSVTCATELAAALDAPLLALPGITRLENGVVLRLTILDAREQRVVGRGQRECEDDPELWPTVIRQLVAAVATPAPDPDLAAPFDADRWRRRLRDLASGSAECRDLADCRARGRERLAEIDRVLATTTFAPDDGELRDALADRRATLARELDALDLAILRQGTTGGGAPAPAAGPARSTATPPAPRSAEARAIVELAALQARRADTEWTWQNRDEKSRLDARIAALQAEVDGYARARAAAAEAQKAPVKTAATAEEITVERELAAVERELGQTTWGWDNRDRKSALERRAERLRVTLDQLRAARGTTGASTRSTP